MKKINQKRILQIISIVVLSFYLACPALAKEINIANVINLVNNAREENGVGELTENKILDQVAADKLEDMVTSNYFAHTSPKGINPWFWYQKNDYDYKYAGENLAINFTRVEDQQQAWMNSPTHRKNILNSNYQEIGVAVGAGEINGQLGIITVQEFGTLASSGAKGSENNFSGKGTENPLKEGAKNSPQVLSMKDFTGEKLINKNVSEKIADNSFSQMSLYNYMFLVSLVLMFISFILSAMSFVTVAAHEIMVCNDIRKKVYDNHIDIHDDKILVS